MAMTITISLALFLLIGSCALGAARVENPSPRPVLHIPYAVVAPALTATPDDPAWSRAAIVPHLSLSLGPDGDTLVPAKTTVRLLWDAQYLYVRFECVDDEVFSPYTHHDDPLYKADATEVFLDAVGDGRQWYETELSPNNIVFDINTVLTSAPQSSADLVLTRDIRVRNYWAMPEYTMPGLKTAAKITAAGYIAEFAFPADEILHRLGLSKYHAMQIHANLLRCEWPRVPGQQLSTDDPTKGRRLMALDWSPVSYGCPHISPLSMGTLILDPKRKQRKQRWSGFPNPN